MYNLAVPCCGASLILRSVESRSWAAGHGLGHGSFRVVLHLLGGPLGAGLGCFTPLGWPPWARVSGVPPWARGSSVLRIMQILKDLNLHIINIFLWG